MNSASAWSNAARATLTLEIRADDDDLALALAYGALRPEVAGMPRSCQPTQTRSGYS